MPRKRTSPVAVRPGKLRQLCLQPFFIIRGFCTHAELSTIEVVQGFKVAPARRAARISRESCRALSSHILASLSTTAVKRRASTQELRRQKHARDLLLCVVHSTSNVLPLPNPSCAKHRAQSRTCQACRSHLPGQLTRTFRPIP
jgi:hypothetical protein